MCMRVDFLLKTRKHFLKMSVMTNTQITAYMPYKMDETYHRHSAKEANDTFVRRVACRLIVLSNINHA